MNPFQPTSGRAVKHGHASVCSSTSREHRAIARRDGERLLAEPEMALQAPARQQSTFTRTDLARLVRRHSEGAAQFAAIMAKVEASPELVRVAKHGRDRARYSTRETIAIERRMEAAALDPSRRTAHPDLWISVAFTRCVQAGCVATTCVPIRLALREGCALPK